MLAASRIAVFAYLGFASAWAMLGPFLQLGRWPLLSRSAAAFIACAWLYQERVTRFGRIHLKDAIVFQDEDVFFPGDEYHPRPTDRKVPLAPDMVRLTVQNAGEVFETRSVFLCWEPDRRNLQRFAQWTDRKKLVQQLEDIFAVNPSPDFESYAALFGIRFTKIDFGAVETAKPDEITDFFDDFLMTATTLADAINKKEQFFADNPQLKQNPELYRRLNTLFTDRAARFTTSSNGKSNTRRTNR